MHYIPLSCTSSPRNLLFLNRGVYDLVQATVGVGTILIWYFAVAYTGGGGGGYVGFSNLWAFHHLWMQHVNLQPAFWLGRLHGSIVFELLRPQFLPRCIGICNSIRVLGVKVFPVTHLAAFSILSPSIWVWHVNRVNSWISFLLAPRGHG